MARTLADEIGRIHLDPARLHHLVGVLVERLDRLHAVGLHPALTPEHVVLDDDDGLTLIGLDAAVSREWPYAAPETIADGTLTVASNIHALGAIAMALVGPRPWSRDRDVLAGWADPDPARRPRSLADVMRQLESLQWDRSSAGRIAPRLDAFIARDAHERALVDALRADPRDTATRDVYADWLEGQGEIDRARFVRGGAAPAPPAGAAWRAVVSRARVRECWHDGCPGRWDALAATHFDNLRSCGTCDARVGYSTSLVEIQLRAARRERFVADDALDPTDVQNAVFEQRVPLGTYNPPRPELLPDYVGPPGNPPIPDRDGGSDTSVLGRFLGLFRKKR